VVLSAGFGEIGSEGKQRAQRVSEEIRKYGMRLLGPNCLGILRPSIGLNATFANVGAKPGALALVAQSGAVCTAILDWAATTEIGFSSVISLGGALDLDFGELLDYLVEDPETRSILLYVEGVRDAKRFMSALRSAARVKPVVVLKAGRNAGGASAVTSHTGALAGSDEVWDAALARAGAVRVQSSLQLFAAARLLADPRIARSLKGERLAIITNGGGPGVVAADEAGAAGLKLATLEASTLAALDEVLPPHWSRGNPVDLIGDATPERFTEALRTVLADNQVDAVLAMYCPQAITSGDDAARAVIPLARESLETGGKPVFTAWLGGASIIGARQLFEDAGVPNFLTPENAVDAFAYLAHFRRHQQMLLQASSAAKPNGFVMRSSRSSAHC
jgi:acetyltransferase